MIDPSRTGVPSIGEELRPEDVPAWVQVQAGSELSELVRIVRFTPGQPSGFLHSEYDAAGLLWRWLLKWARPAGAAPLLGTQTEEQTEDQGTRGGTPAISEHGDLPQRATFGGSATVTKDLAEWLRESLRSGLLFGCFDEPLDEAGKRVVRAILARLQ